ncbi:LysR family transcriptional regulator [Sinomonas soli]
MELRSLHYFSTVAELGSISRAAVALHLTQPSLSRQLAALERELGHELFTRTSRGAQLTPAGRGLHGHLRVVFAEVDRIPEVLRTASESKELVRVGLPPGVPHGWLSAVVRRAQEAIPQADISLHEASSDEQRLMLKDGRLEIGLLHLAPPEYPAERVLTQRIGVALPPDSPLASRPSIRFADLAGLRVMAHANGEVAGEETRLRAASKAAGVTTDWIFRRFSQHSELIAMSSRADAALMTEASATHNMPSWRWVEVKEVDAEGHPLTVETWAATSSSGHPYVQRFIELLRAEGLGARG